MILLFFPLFLLPYHVKMIRFVCFCVSVCFGLGWFLFVFWLALFSVCVLDDRDSI